MRTLTFAVTALVAFGSVQACAPKRIDDEQLQVMENGDRVRENTAAVDEARERATNAQAAAADRRGEILASALATCAPRICEAVTRGEVAIGMNPTQVLAATGTTEDAWQIRTSGNSTVFVPLRLDDPPTDAVADVALVQLRDNQVASYSYREAQGVRLVSDATQATTEGRADALAEMLIREGDDYAARGDLDAALDRYDRASVLRAGDPMLEYRIATVLDQQLRPIEALMRYQLFLHRLDLERIDAVGDAYANIASAMVHARERIIVLERHQQ